MAGERRCGAAGRNPADGVGAAGVCAGEGGDIDGSGALLGGRQVAMNLSGDLLNSGAINGRETVQLSAENITNKAGAINGADVSLLARTDINNIAGMITGNDSVLASAGRDINIVTTTRSAQSAAGQNSFARTTLDRVGAFTFRAKRANFRSAPDGISP